MLKKDHREVDAMFKRYEGLGERAGKTKQNLVKKIIQELSVHASIEEQVLYPTMRDRVPESESLLEEAYKEHAEAKEDLAELERMDPQAEDFDSTVRALIKEVKHHVKEEENELFPMLRRELPKQDLMEMAERMRRARKSAPKAPSEEQGARVRKAS